MAYKKSQAGIRKELERTPGCNPQNYVFPEADSTRLIRGGTSITPHRDLGAESKHSYEVKPLFLGGRDMKSFGGSRDLAIVGLKKAVLLAEMAARYNKAVETDNKDGIEKISLELREAAGKYFK